MKLMEPDGANKTIQQESILVWLTELNEGKIEKPEKKTAFQKNYHFPEWCLKTR
jgi:hypothetical protein